MTIIEKLEYMFDNGLFDSANAGIYVSYKECADHIKELHDILRVLTADPKTQPYSATKEWRDMVCNVRLRIAAALEA